MAPNLCEEMKAVEQSRPRKFREFLNPSIGKGTWASENRICIYSVPLQPVLAQPSGRHMSLSLTLGLIYLGSEILLTITRRSRSKTGTKQDKSTLFVLWIVIVA